jgi:hypothetical protein
MKNSRWNYALQVVYAAVSSLFLIGVLYQVYLTGLIVVTGKSAWRSHVEFGHALSLPLLVMLLTMYLSRMPRRIKRYTWILFGIYVLQADVVIILRSLLPSVAALHPVLALVDFALGWRLTRESWGTVRENRAGRAVQELVDPRPESAG